MACVYPDACALGTLLIYMPLVDPPFCPDCVLLLRSPRLLRFLTVGIHASRIPIPLSLLGGSLLCIASLTLVCVHIVCVHILLDIVTFVLGPEAQGGTQVYK